MNAEEIPIVPLMAGTLAALYFGYEIDKRRTKLRALFNTFDKHESRIAFMLEKLVESGELTPFTPPAHT